eukprot:g20744.t1
MMAMTAIQSFGGRKRRREAPLVQGQEEEEEAVQGVDGVPGTRITRFESTPSMTTAPSWTSMPTSTGWSTSTSAASTLGGSGVRQQNGGRLEQRPIEDRHLLQALGHQGLVLSEPRPPGGAASALDNDGLRPLKPAIEGVRGRPGNYRFMPGDGSRVQDSRADGGVAEEARLLMTAHIRAGQESSSLKFHLRENPAEHPRQASSVRDKKTGRAATRKFPKRHATCVIGDGVAFGRASGMVHEVVAAPAAPGGRRAGTLTIFVGVTWPEAATGEQRLQRQKDLARRLAAVKDVDPALPQYAAGLHIPGKEDVDPPSLSATNTAYNNCVIHMDDGTTTTNASRNGSAGGKLGGQL